MYASSPSADKHAANPSYNTIDARMARIESADGVTTCSLLQTSLVRLDCMRNGMKNALVVLSAQRHTLRPAHFHH